MPGERADKHKNQQLSEIVEKTPALDKNVFQTSKPFPNSALPSISSKRQTENKNKSNKETFRVDFTLSNSQNQSTLDLTSTSPNTATESNAESQQISHHNVSTDEKGLRSKKKKNRKNKLELQATSSNSALHHDKHQMHSKRPTYHGTVRSTIRGSGPVTRVAWHPPLNRKGRPIGDHRSSNKIPVKYSFDEENEEDGLLDEPIEVTILDSSGDRVTELVNTDDANLDTTDFNNMFDYNQYGATKNLNSKGKKRKSLKRSRASQSGSSNLNANAFNTQDKSNMSFDSSLNQNKKRRSNKQSLELKRRKRAGFDFSLCKTKSNENVNIFGASKVKQSQQLEAPWLSYQWTNKHSFEKRKEYEQYIQNRRHMRMCKKEQRRRAKRDQNDDDQNRIKIRRRSSKSRTCIPVDYRNKDPVALLNYYKCQWNRFYKKIPGASTHSKVRQIIHDKMNTAPRTSFKKKRPEQFIY